MHILAHAEGLDPSDPAVLRFNWYPYVSDATFNKDAARQFFGETCGFSEKSRNYIIDQIDFDRPGPSRSNAQLPVVLLHGPAGGIPLR